MSFAQDLRYALRSFARTPGVTATLILTIALGVGGNAAMFGFIGGLVTLEIDGAASDASERFQRIAGLLAGASALVLFLASSTVTNLLLTRARSRAHEMAVRTALGAGRARLAALCLADSLVISAIGGSVGVACGYWASRLFPLLFFQEDAEYLSMSPDMRWLAVASAVWVVVLLASALAPIVPVWRQLPWSVLRQESSGAPAGAVRLRNRLVTAQIAVCCLLLLVAGVIRDDLQSTMRTARGLGLGSLLVVTVEGGATYLGNVQSSLLEHPDVLGLAWAATLPAGRAIRQNFVVEAPEHLTRPIEFEVSTFDPSTRTADTIVPMAGRSFVARDLPDAPRVALINATAAERYFAGDAVARMIEDWEGRRVEIVGVLPAVRPGATEPPSLFYFENQVPAGAPRQAETFYAADDLTRTPAPMDINVVSTTYFTVFADPVVDGQPFDAGTSAGGRSVAVVSQAGAEMYFGGEAVGRTLIGPRGRLEIIGVVAAAPLGAAERGSLPMLFLPLGQASQPQMSLAVRSTSVSDDTIRNLRGVVSGIAGGVPITPMSTFEEHLVRNSLAPERVTTAMIGVMAIGAILLSVVGIHGAMTDLVARRRAELALRIALGARPGVLVSDVVRAALRLGAVGAAAGLAGALLMAPVLAAVLGHAGLPNVTVLAMALGTVAVLVTGSSAMPAWRAVTVDPREVMR